MVAGSSRPLKDGITPCWGVPICLTIAGFVVAVEPDRVVEPRRAHLRHAVAGLTMAGGAILREHALAPGRRLGVVRRGR